MAKRRNFSADFKAKVALSAIKTLQAKVGELIDERYLKTPWYGSRQMKRKLRRQGLRVNREWVRRLMRKMGLVAVAPAPNTSRRHPRH